MRTSVAAALAALALAAPSTLAAGGDPVASTGSATSVTATSAVIGGTVNPNGSATTYQVQYGTSGAYGSATAPGSAGSGTTATTISVPIGGLAPNTTYHYRVVATNPTGTGDGTDATFTTVEGAAVAHAARPHLGHRHLGARRRERQPQRRRDERDLPVRAHDRLRVDQRRHLGRRGHLAAARAGDHRGAGARHGLPLPRHRDERRRHDLRRRHRIRHREGGTGRDHGRGEHRAQRMAPASRAPSFPPASRPPTSSSTGRHLHTVSRPR